MSSVVLNLSRKWRSQDFDQIVGQDLVVRILKNSIYLGHYFPVYLFAGQRGCGKTSTARIFAAAVNCYGLSAFQKDPKKSSIPCLLCVSCVAMTEGRHPDFIEIDAASHTGVDNIRNIIDSSSLLPLMGKKRVYLIDEAHMLSKAAFNAALKILEEPPAAAIFILATTNPHKIIDTVKSRCFQLFFTSIAYGSLKNRLKLICEHEKIPCTDEALDLIARYTSGSARDAINLLEQVRFSSAMVSKDAVLLLLSHIDDQYILELIRFTIKGLPTQLVELLHSLQIDQQKAEFIWERMVVMLRALLWIKYGVSPRECTESIKKSLEESAQIYSLFDLHSVIEALYQHEELFVKAAMRHIFLEMVLLNLCNKKRNNNGNNSASSLVGLHDVENVVNVEKPEDSAVDIEDLSLEQKWQSFIVRLEALHDPLLCSLFKQAQFFPNMHDMNHITIELLKDFILFKESLEKAEPAWKPILQNIFSAEVKVDITFTGIQKSEIVKRVKSDVVINPIPVETIARPVSSPPFRSQEQFRGHQTRYSPKNNAVNFNKNELKIDVSDKTTWKKSAMLLQHFPGTITEIRENK